MITISTYDLVGMTKDVLGFAPSARTARDMAYLRFACDGTSLQISTYAETHAAVATWTPPETPGGAGDPWEVLIKSTDAKDLVDNFKLTGGRSETPLVVESVSGYLVVTRQAVDDEKLSVSYKKARYCGELDQFVPKATERFADLGAHAPHLALRVADPVLVPLGKACKRTGETARMTQFDDGVRALVGEELTVTWRHPLEVNQDEVDAAAIVETALAEV